MYGLSLGVPPLSSGTPSASVSTLAACAAPPAQANLPLAVAPGVKAATDRPRSRELAPVELQCRVGGCADSQADWHLRMCEYHAEVFRDRVYDMTRDVGRGQL